MSLQDEFDRVASSAKFNGLSLLRNPNPNNINLMAGITGADTSLLTVAAANSHKYAGEYAFYSDTDNSGVVLGNDVTAYVNYNSGLSSNPDNSRFSGKSISTIRLDDGSEANFSFLITRVLQDSPGLVPVGPTPATLNVMSHVFSSYGSTGGTSAISSTDSEFTLAGTIGSASYSVKIDLSDITYTSHENPNDVVRSTNIGLTNILHSSQAKIALDTVQNRIDDLSKLQGNFGAVESRLNVAANKLLVDRENYQAAASQITDVDVATEAANLTSTQILQQAAVPILAQANLQPRIALQLLGGL